jgi:arylsulfatase A-like enzyme
VVFDKARSWLQTGPSEPFFLFIHLMDVHSPYIPPGTFATKFGHRAEGALTDAELNEKLNILSREANPLFFQLYESGQFDRMNELEKTPEDIGENNLQRLIDLYDGEIAYTDSQLQKFNEELEASSKLGATLLMITADHGEAFLDHGRLFHSGDQVYDELMRVPLIMKYPGIIAAGTSIGAPVRLIDIMPTVLDIAGETGWGRSAAWPRLELEGRSLLPLFRGDEEELALRDRGNVYCEGAYVACVRTKLWKYIDSEGHNVRELFDLVADPGEKVNLFSQMEEQAGRFAAILEDYAERVRLYQEKHPGPTSTVIDEDTIKRLRSLGYVE